MVPFFALAEVSNHASDPVACAVPYPSLARISNSATLSESEVGERARGESSWTPERTSTAVVREGVHEDSPSPSPSPGVATGYTKFTGPLQVVHMICLQIANYAVVLT